MSRSPPDWISSAVCKSSRGADRLRHASPELPGAPEFIGKPVRAEDRGGAGPSAGSSDQIRAAVDAGARHCTHLGNGFTRICPASELSVGPAGEDRLSAGVIADGHHLPPAVFKTFVRAKARAHDSSERRGSPPRGCHRPLRMEPGSSDRDHRSGRIQLADTRPVWLRTAPAPRSV